MLLGLFIQIGDGEVGAQRAKRLGAAPGDRLIIGNADDQSLLALERDLGFRKHRNGHDTLSRFVDDDGWLISSASVCCAIISSSSVGMT